MTDPRPYLTPADLRRLADELDKRAAAIEPKDRVTAAALRGDAALLRYLARGDA